jgi:hypothetical protein
VDDFTTRRAWPRVVLIVDPATRDRLHELARRNDRDPRREAARLFTAAVQRELEDLDLQRELDDIERVPVAQAAGR